MKSIAVLINGDGVNVKGDVSEAVCEDNGQETKKLGVLCDIEDIDNLRWAATLVEDPREDLNIELVGGRA
jgi:hypothetical protein